MKKNTFSKLKKYAALATTSLVAGTTDAAIDYTNIVDFVGGVGDTYDVDLNNDAIPEFTIRHDSGSNLFIDPLSSSAEVLGTGGATFAYPYVMSNGATISSAASSWFNNGYGGGFQSMNYGSCSFGNWCNIVEGNLGVRFNIGADTHYGWIRLTNVDNGGASWTVTDYAYEQCVDQPITAGATTGGASCPGPAEECTTAFTIACANSYTGSTTGGSVIGETTCGTTAGTGGANWHTFTGDGSTWTFSTDNASTDFDTKLWLYSGACGTLTCVDGDDDGASDVFASNSSELSHLTAIGTTYYLVVGGFNTAEGSYGLDVTCSSMPPTSSECASAIPATSTCGTNYTGSTVGDTPQTEGTCGTSAGTGGAIWYSMTGDGNNWTASTVNPGTSYDTKLWIFDGSCGALSCVDGNDDDVGTASTVSFATTIGTTYYVVVGGYNANEGDYEMSLNRTPGSFTSDPADIIGCDGDIVEFISAFSGYADSTVWQISFDTAASWIDLGFAQNSDTISGSVSPGDFLIRNSAYSCGSIIDSSTAALAQVFTPTDTTINVSSCGNYTSPSGKTFTTTNTYMDTIPNANMCDSVMTINLTVNPNQTGTDIVSSCGSYTWRNGVTYTSDNTTATYTESGVAAGGCDSIYTLNLTINNNEFGTDIASACGSYTWRDGIIYTSSNTTATYTEPGVSTNGCDSVYTLNLTINSPETGTDIIAACDSYVWRDGVTYTSNNTTATYTELGVATNGCDSIYTLNLSMGQSETSTETVVTCASSYIWAANGMTYSSDGMYTANLMNAANCDSTVTLDLTFDSYAQATINVDGGDSAMVFGNTYYSNITVNDTAIGGASAGCDSITIANVTVNPTTTSNETVITCTSYTWPANGMTYTMTGNYSVTLMNANNCDSVANLDLTIGSFAYATTNVNGCDAVTLFGNTYTNSTVAYDTIIDGAGAGCDSITEATIVVNQSTSSTFDETINFDESYLFDGTTLITSGTYNATIPNSVGCDSNITLNLTVLPNGIADFANGLKVYPNPTNHLVTLEADIKLDLVRIVDTKGSVLISRNVKSFKENIDLSNIDSGIYFYEIIDIDGNISRGKVIKED